MGAAIGEHDQITEIAEPVGKHAEIGAAVIDGEDRPRRAAAHGDAVVYRRVPRRDGAQQRDGRAAALTGALLAGSKGLLLLAVTATAMRTRLDLLLDMGWRAAVPVLGATLASFAAALGFALVLVD